MQLVLKPASISSHHGPVRETKRTTWLLIHHQEWRDRSSTKRGFETVWERKGGDGAGEVLICLALQKICSVQIMRLEASIERLIYRDKPIPSDTSHQKRVIHTSIDAVLVQARVLGTPFDLAQDYPRPPFCASLWAFSALFCAATSLRRTFLFEFFTEQILIRAMRRWKCQVSASNGIWNVTIQ